MNKRQLSFPQRTRAPSGPRPAQARGNSLRVAGLFAGIGGLELGLQRAGHHAGLLCEIEPGARAVLDAKFADVPKHDDVCTLKRLPPGTDLLVAGFPCQDLSQAGQTAGIGGMKSGLVSEVFRLIESERTEWVLLENVPFMLQLARGRALEVIVGTLERLGYKWAYRVIDSRAFGVPQRRERVFMLASRSHDPRTVLFADDSAKPAAPEDWRTYACGFYWTEGIRGLGWAVDSVPTLKGGSTIGIPSQPAVLMPSGDIVKPDIRDAERLQGFTADWTRAAEAVTKRGHRWKLVGNAVTVDVAEWIGQCLANPREYEIDWAVSVKKGSAWPKAGWNVGEGRFTTELSTWPVKRSSKRLDAFLRYECEPLSAKATAGFLKRARTGSLRFPDGFLSNVEAHLERVSARLSA